MKLLLRNIKLAWLRRNDQRGHSIIEMSLLMLPFMLVLLAVMEFGWYFFHQHTLQYATREGMRLALVGEVLVDGQGNPLTREQSIDQTIRQNAAWALNENDLLIQFGPLGANYVDPNNFSDPNQAPNAGNPADYMRIRVTYDHQFFTPLLGRLFNPGCNEDCKVTLQAEATYRNELFVT